MTTAPAQPPPPVSGPPVYTETGWPAIAREGWPIVGCIGGGSLVLILLFNFFFGPGGFAVAVLLGAPVTLWSLWFFRDPVRRTPNTPGLIVSPADGVVCFIGPSSPPSEMGLEATMTRVSIFIEHLQRARQPQPVRGIGRGGALPPGAFLNASFDKASEQNERCGLVLRVPDGRQDWLRADRGTDRASDRVPRESRRRTSRGAAVRDDPLRVAAGCVPADRGRGEGAHRAEDGGRGETELADLGGNR
jgi:phosphatidylserine decarboxylase